MAENEEELKSITGEESLNSFMELVQKLKDEPWTSRLNDILDAFEDFLTIRPERFICRYKNRTTQTLQSRMQGSRGDWREKWLYRIM